MKICVFDIVSNIYVGARSISSHWKHPRVVSRGQLALDMDMAKYQSALNQYLRLVRVDPCYGVVDELLDENSV